MSDNPYVRKLADEFLAAETAYLFERYPSVEADRRERRWRDAATRFAGLVAADFASPAARAASERAQQADRNVNAQHAPPVAAAP